MPGVALPCIAEYMPILGLDIHMEIPPFPTPAPIPHLVLFLIRGFRSQNTSRAVLSVISPIGPLVGRNHDAAPLVAHIPIPLPSILLLPVVMAGTSSKCEFGAGSVKLGKSGYPAAIGLLFVVGPQLHCNEVCPLPTGVVISGLNFSVRAGFGWADLLGSLAGMLYDIAVGWAIAKLNGLLAKGLTSVIGRGVMALLPAGFAQIAFAIVGPPFLEAYVGIGTGFALGGPMGWAPSWSLYSRATTPKSAGGWGLIPAGDDAYNWGRGLL
jgi:hypothetical protein